MSDSMRTSSNPAPPTDSGNLGARARQSVLWNTGMNLVTNVGQFGLMLVLVRLLAPEIYGQFGLLTAVMGFLFVFSAQGTIDYTVQGRSDDDIPISEIFIFALSTSIALCLLANLVAAVMRYLPKYSAIAGLLHVMSFTFLLHPARALRVAMLQRALDWRRIRILHLSGFAVSAIFSITLAYAGAGIYALIISSFLVPLPYIIDLLWVSRWRPTWEWNSIRFRPALAFGMNRLLSNILAAARRLVESTVIVQLLGFAAFGAYGRAVGLSDVLCARLAGQTLEALYPAITKIET
jgi:O-antigen/teichoic acid export membrane protein